MKDLTLVTFPTTLKLTTSNYLAWKTQVEALLYGLDLFKFIDGSHPPPKPTLTTAGIEVPHKEFHHWFRQDKLLFGALVGSLSLSIVPMISGASSSYEAWQILAKTYASPSSGHIKQLKFRLKKTSKTPTQSISEYMQDIKVIVDELAILGKKMDDEDVISAILTGLDQISYRPILDAIHARDTTISFNELHEKLINHELSLAQQASSTSIHQPASIFYAQNLTSGKPLNTKHSPPLHLSTSTSFSPKQGSDGILPTPTASTKLYLGKCQWCLQKGHSLTHCPVFKKVHPTISIPQYNRGSPGKPHVHTMTTVPGSSTNWLFDSGASHHVTNDLNNLSLHSPYDGTEELVIGDGPDIESPIAPGNDHQRNV